MAGVVHLKMSLICIYFYHFESRLKDDFNVCF